MTTDPKNLAARRLFKSLRARGFTLEEIRLLAQMSDEEGSRWLFERSLILRGYPSVVASAMASMTPQDLDRAISEADTQRSAGVPDIRAERVKRAASGVDLESAIVAEVAARARALS